MWTLAAKKVGGNIYLAPFSVSKVRLSHKVKGYTKHRKSGPMQKKKKFHS